MQYLLTLALRSALNRKLTLGMTVISIALSVALMIGVERLRHAAQQSFTQSVAGTDLVVGARTSPVQLILYAVFHIGDATSNIRWHSYQAIAAHPSVAWTIPVTMGDSHHGFPVTGTTTAYFKHLHYGDHQPLTFASGRPFNALFEAVIGSEVAKQLGYHSGDHITLTHGMSQAGNNEHADKPFTITGILSATGTPVDRSIYVSLEAIEAIHLDWQGGTKIAGLSIPAEYAGKFDLKPKEITAFLVGLKSRVGVFRMQRMVNDFEAEPLLAVLPGVALDQLWQVTAVAEKALLAVSAMVVVVGLCGLMAVILASLNERRRELAILRSVGASPRHLFLLLSAEGLFVTLAGTLTGILLLTTATTLLAPLIQSGYGLTLVPALLLPDELKIIAVIMSASLLAAITPAYSAYRLSLSDGLTPRI